MTRSRTGSVEYAVCFLSSALFILIIGAFAVAFAASFSPLFSKTESVRIAGGYIARTALRTFAIAFFSTLTAAAVGIGTAFFTANRSFPGKRLILSLSAVPLCVPSLVIALGFVAVFGINGAVNSILIKIFHVKNAPLTFLYSTAGIVVVQGFYNFPLVTAVVSSSWETLSPVKRDAARMLGANERRIFFTVTLHELSPAIAASCVPVFLYCFFSFMIVLLFGSPGSSTLETEIYRAARASLDFKTAAVLALIETLCAMTVLFVYGACKSTAETGEVRHTGEAIAPPIGRAPYEEKPAKIIECVFAAFLAFLVALFFLAPLAGIAAGGFSAHGGLPSFIKIINSQGFKKALCGTCMTAPCTALLCVTAGFTYASYIRIRDPLGTSEMLRTLPMLPMALSSVVMGVGMTIAVRRASVATLVLAEAALAWPLAFRQIYASLCTVPQAAIDAGRMLSPVAPDTVFRIMIPSAKRGIVSAFGFCFAVSMGDTALPLVLSVPRFDTLSLYTYRLASAYRFSDACICGTILCVLCALVFACCKKINNFGTAYG
ncbi:iron ABC transporter permease [Treponema socranskii]|uniref:ABC transporter permease n=1 Tax=Treponema socranskii TaxID=53419 RepID=UPI003D94D0DF